MFGFIFQGGGSAGLTLGWVDEDGSPASAPAPCGVRGAGGRRAHRWSDRGRRAGAACTTARSTRSSSCPAGLRRRRRGRRQAGTGPPTTVDRLHGPVPVQPRGRRSTRWSAACPRRRQPRRPAADRRSRSGRDASRPRTSTSSATSCPSMLGLSVMQVGIFAAIPLVADREKLILKRLAATPLRRWQLVGSNVLMRLLIALVQSVIIVARRRRSFFGVEIIGPPAADRRVRRPGRRRLPGPRLRHRVVREDRGRGQRHDQRRSSSR